MADYIDREAFLKSVLTAGIGKTIVEYSESDIGYMIRKQPAADVVPVKHGKWIKTHNVVCNWYKCSLCHQPIPFGRYKNEYFSNYCPNCGAKMDGDGEIGGGDF